MIGKFSFILSSFLSIAANAQEINMGGGSTGPASPGSPSTTSVLAGCRYVAAGASLTDGQQVAIQCDNSGTVYVRSDAVVNAINSAALVPPIQTTLAASALNGNSTFFNSTLSTTPVSVKSSSGTLTGWKASNRLSGNNECWLQVFDLATGSVTLGVTVPKMSVDLAANGMDDYYGFPLQFSTAITIAATTTPTGSSACGANVVVDMFYK